MLAKHAGISTVKTNVSCGKTIHDLSIRELHELGRQDILDGAIQGVTMVV
jgi:hypothetical protein